MGSNSNAKYGSRGSTQRRGSGPACDTFVGGKQSEPEQSMGRIARWDSADDWIQVVDKNTLSKENAIKPTIISVDNFVNCVLESQKPMVLYVHSERCRGCRVQLQIMQDLATRLVGALDLFLLDGEQSPGVLAHLGITHAPTVVLIDKGKVLCIIEGITPVASLLVVIHSHFGILVSDRETIMKGG